MAETIRYGKLGARRLRLVRKGTSFYGMADGKVCTKGNNPDNVWQRLQDDAGKSDPRYFGYEGARARFLQFFPDGFHSDSYVSQERGYKLAAKERLDAAAPLEEAVAGQGFGEAVLGAFRATNLLSKFEMIRVQELLRGRNADVFIQASAKFTKDATKLSLSNLERALKSDECAKWTVTTYLPHLWLPDAHMFLKPQATNDFAARVGHPFASLYGARLDLDVYESLLDLAKKTAEELADLAPRDGIDIQSFIWVVGNYQEDQRTV
ncbi:MAG: hypothetical protein OXC05_05365 [Halieaceae bacterium]|nr:hypothetical protein [Halieaceae bacterium]